MVGEVGFAEACDELLAAAGDVTAELPPVPQKDFYQHCCCSGGPDLPAELEDGRRAVPPP